MKPFQLHFFSSPIIWSITFLFIICYPICCNSDQQWYNTCGSFFSCGNITNVGFPFWGGDTRPNLCGYTDLGLSCEKNVTIIQIKGMKYHVLEINQETQILRIAREDLLKGICMQKFINTTLDFELFDYASGSKNITVLYGCPPPYTYTPDPSHFTCKISGVDETAAYPIEGAFGPSGCNASIVVPVLESSAEQIGKSTLGRILAKGFEAKYKVEGEELCNQCQASNGRCGFDVKEDETCCICPDGNVRYTACNISTPGMFLL